MPSRSFFLPPDFAYHEAILTDIHGPSCFETIAKARAANCAPLLDIRSLAHLIGVSPKLLSWVVLNPQKNYRTFTISKRCGGDRMISSPRVFLKVIQWWILDNILRPIELPSHVTGFVRGRGAFANACIHSGQNHLLNVDLKDFFPSISSDRVRQFWSGFPYPEDVARQLTRLTTFMGSLPQGAPTSPAIANLIALSMDKDLHEYSNKNNMLYSRYADDLTFSSKDWIYPDSISEIAHVARRHSFRINGAKVRRSGRGDRMEVTGFVINHRPQLPRRWRNKARGIFYRAYRNPAQYLDRIAELNGILGAIATYEHGALSQSRNASRLFNLGQRAIEATKEARKEISTMARGVSLD